MIKKGDFDFVMIIIFSLMEMILGVPLLVYTAKPVLSDHDHKRHQVAVLRLAVV